MARILVAEDERDIRELINLTLMFAGHEVTLAANGEEATLLAAQVKPDLILLDVRMPRMTGYEACKAIKAQDDLKAIPVVFLTAKGQDEEMQMGKEAGATAYILKPFAPDELTRRIQELLHQHGDAGG
jgi:DNA-binding response OmpR family regulator